MIPVLAHGMAGLAEAIDMVFRGIILLCFIPSWAIALQALDVLLRDPHLRTGADGAPLHYAAGAGTGLLVGILFLLVAEEFDLKWTTTFMIALSQGLALLTFGAVVFIRNRLKRKRAEG